MRKKYLIWAVVAVAIIMVGYLTISRIQQNSNQSVSSNQEKILDVKLGLSIQPSNGLLWVAVDKNFFLEEGLNVQVQEFAAGKLALQAMLGGSVDLTTPAEFPVVLASVNGEKLSILTQVNETSGGFPMIFRKDNEETFNTSTYFIKKRKIGTSVGGGPEYFTQDFFNKYQIKPSQYEIVGMKPEDLPIALVNGSIDAMAIFEPFTHFAIERAGAENLFVIYDEDLYSETIVLTGKTDWVKTHNEEVNRFIRALKKSYDFIKSNPDEAMTSVALHTKLDLATVISIWPTFTYELGLQKKLIASMENEAKWASETGKTKNEISGIDFQQILFPEPLQALLPGLVNL
ncbi:MAG: ABC transporter substrate-binding protein [Candidatus Magasanikiibacteriota bacterium]